MGFTQEMLQAFTIESYIERHRYDPILSDHELEAIAKGYVSLSEVKMDLEAKKKALLKAENKEQRQRSCTVIIPQ